MKKYDAYKDSGVKWIGEIPNHWEVVPLKRTGSFENGLTYSPNDIRDKGYIVLRSSNIQNSKMNYEDTVYVESVPNDLLVKKGDIIICSRNGSASLVGKCAKFDGKIAATFGAFMMRYSPSINNEYAFFSFQILMRNYKGLFTTSTINQLTKNVIAQMVCPLPPLSEQQAIASYLDAKTEKIDKMIAKAEKKIEYLGELKQSLITRAVTRGLNPNTPLKDSGVNWIGNIPMHWDIACLRFFLRLINGRAYSQNELLPSGKYKVLRVGNFFTNDSWYYSNMELEPDKYCDKDDLLYAWSASVGPYIWNEAKTIYHYHIWKVQLATSMDKMYSYYLLRAVTNQKMSDMHGSTMMHITMGDMNKTKIPIPPLSEQQQIATYLDTKCSKIDHIIATQKKKIAYLQELKQSLITNVVTGKIKVS